MVFIVFNIIKSFSVPIPFLSNLCLNSSTFFPSFFNYFLLTLISGLGFGFGFFKFDIFSFDDISFGVFSFWCF